MSSGVTTFNETRDELISNALQLIGYLAAGETASTADITFCSKMLNAMVKAWQAQGIHLWTMKEGTLYLVNGQAQYVLASSGGAECSSGKGTPVETTLSSQANIGATTIQVTTSTGMSVSDNIGIVQDDNTIFWTTISAINGTSVDIASGLTVAASSSNNVYTYEQNLGKVLSIQSARCRDSGNFDRYMMMVPHNDYMMIPQKSLTGLPTTISYLPGVSTGTVYVWPTPYQVSSRIEFTYLAMIEDFVTGSDTADFPTEWLECLTYNLCVRIAPAYGINLAQSPVLQMAAQFLDDLKAWDTEQPYLRIVPPYRNKR